MGSMSSIPGSEAVNESARFLATTAQQFAGVQRVSGLTVKSACCEQRGATLALSAGLDKGQHDVSCFFASGCACFCCATKPWPQMRCLRQGLKQGLKQMGVSS